MSGYRNHEGVYFDERGCAECFDGELPCHCCETPTACVICGMAMPAPFECPIHDAALSPTGGA